MTKRSSNGVGRGAFLAGIATASAAAAAAGTPPAPAAAAEPPAKLAPPSAQLAAAESQPPGAFPADRLHVRNPGSDFMVDCFKHVGLDYIAAMPGNTFCGLHESIINYGANVKPELLSTTHEEISAAMAHGYAKISGKPMAIMVHNTVGLQHASMAIYDAWADRVPMIVIAANEADASKRSNAVDWDHSAVDVAAIVRGYIKYDDQPASLTSYGESFDAGLLAGHDAADGTGAARVRRRSATGTRRGTSGAAALRRVRPPVGDAGALDEAAKMMVAAKNPIIYADRAVRTASGLAAMVSAGGTVAGAGHRHDEPHELSDQSPAESKLEPR